MIYLNHGATFILDDLVFSFPRPSLSTFGADRPAYDNSTCRQPAGAGIDRYGHLEVKGSEERENAI